MAARLSGQACRCEKAITTKMAAGPLFTTVFTPQTGGERLFLCCSISLEELIRAANWCVQLMLFTPIKWVVGPPPLVTNVSSTRSSELLRCQVQPTYGRPTSATTRNSVVQLSGRNYGGSYSLRRHSDW